MLTAESFSLFAKPGFHYDEKHKHVYKHNDIEDVHNTGT